MFGLFKKKKKTSVKPERTWHRVLVDLIPETELYMDPDDITQEWVLNGVTVSRARCSSAYAGSWRLNDVQMSNGDSVELESLLRARRDRYKDKQLNALTVKFAPIVLICEDPNSILISDPLK